MKNIENKNEDLILSQQSLLEKVQKINKLFKNHFDSLSLFVLNSICTIILISYSFLTGQSVSTLAQRYGLFGIIVDIIQFVVLILMLIYFTYQISVYYSFVKRGNRSIRKIKQDASDIEDLQYKLHHGIATYVNNVSTFFKQYSKEKTKLSDIVSVFLYMNFLFGFYVIFIILRLIVIDDPLIGTGPASLFFFLNMIVLWLVSFGTSIKIRKNILIWEKIIPKLDTWGQELENLPSNTSNKSDNLKDE